MVGQRTLDPFILVRVQVPQQGVFLKTTPMRDLDWEGVGKREFPVAELFKPRGLKAQLASSPIPAAPVMLKIKSKKIVVDTNICLYYFGEKTKKSAKKLLDQLSQNNIISISHISCFEVIKNVQDLSGHYKYLTFINSFQRIPIDSPVIMNAATLYYVYKKCNLFNLTKQPKDQLLDRKDKLTGDLLIGASVLSYSNHLLLTANKKDFPSKFWREVEVFEIGDNEEKIKVYMLDPIMEEIEKIIGREKVDPGSWPSRKSRYEFRG
jgi:predicted nucleic acid-binding protein